MAALEGRCVCGSVTIAVAGQHEETVGACHCRPCQRWSGGAFFCFSAAPGAVAVTGEVRLFRSSPFAERAFCPACGSHLWFRDLPDGKTPDKTPSYELVPGLFNDARGWPLRSEVYADRAMACATLAGTHPRKTREEYEARNKFVPGDLD